MALLGFGASLWWRQAQGPDQPSLESGTLIVPARDLAPFSLLDLHGAPFTRASLMGHWSLLFFGYTNCPDVCPTTLATLAALDRELSRTGARVRPRVVFVSVDARRDTPAVLARYVPYFDAGFAGVTAATQEQIERFARGLGALVIIGEDHGGTYSVDHSAALFVISPQGKLAAILSGPHEVARLRADLAKIVEASS